MDARGRAGGVEDVAQTRRCLVIERIPDMDMGEDISAFSQHRFCVVAEIGALRAGKHGLCEKPNASNADEAAQMARVADETGLLLVEAFHYRYHPLADRIRAV